MGLAVGGFGTYVTELVGRGITPGLAGFGSTLFLFGQFAVVWPTDALSRRFSVRRVAAVGLALGAAGTALGGVLSLPVALGGRLLLGFGMGATFLAAMTYAGLRVEDEQVARMQGLLGASFTLGLAVGLAVTPGAVAVVGPRLLGLVAAVPVALATVLAPSLQPVETREHQRFGAYVDAFRSPVGVGLGFANAASYGLLIVATTWYTDVLAQVPSLPATLVLTGFALVLTGFGFGLPFGPLFSLAFENVGADAGVLLVGMTAIGNAVALAYPWLVGELLEVTAGYAVGFLVLSLSTAAVVVVWRRTL
jgi:DHA1 family inner membrane transport protein